MWRCGTFQFSIFTLCQCLLSVFSIQPSRSLFARTFSPCSYVLSSPKALCNSPENHKSVTFCPFPLDYWKYFHIFAPCFARDTRHSRLYIPNHHLGQRSQIATKSVGAYYAQAFQRLQWLVVSRECVEMACVFHLRTNFVKIWKS